MKRFVSILPSGVRQKVSAGLLILVFLGVVGEGRIFLASQPAQSVTPHRGVSHAVVFLTPPHQSTERQLYVPPSPLDRAVPLSALVPGQKAAAQHVAVPHSATVASMINQTFGSYAAAAMAVASCESGLNPNAYNSSSGASGVFQFLPSTWRTTPYAGYSPFNAWANIHAARSVFVRDGYSWGEWSCQP
jgi:hypothetical protein